MLVLHEGLWTNSRNCEYLTGYIPLLALAKPLENNIYTVCILSYNLKVLQTPNYILLPYCSYYHCNINLPISNFLLQYELFLKSLVHMLGMKYMFRNHINMLLSGYKFVVTKFIVCFSSSSRYNTSLYSFFQF